MELTGDEALDYLNNREMTLGGYIQKITLFHTVESQHPPFPVLVFVATPKSSYWLGPADPHIIADQVTTLIKKICIFEKNSKKAEQNLNSILISDVSGDQECWTLWSQC